MSRSAGPRRGLSAAAAAIGTIALTGCSLFGGSADDAYPVQATAKGATPEFLTVPANLEDQVLVCSAAQELPAGVTFG